MVTLVGRSIRKGQVKHHTSPMSLKSFRTLARHENNRCSLNQKRNTEEWHGWLARRCSMTELVGRSIQKAGEAPSPTNVVMATTYRCTQ